MTELRRLTVAQYRNAIAAIFDGQVTPSERYPGGFGQSLTGFSTEAALNTVGELATEQLMTAAEDVAVDVHDALPQLLSCSSGETCFDTFLGTYARRAFRRTLDEGERAALLDTFRGASADGATFAEATAIATSQLLQSPQFLYVVEAEAGTGRALTGPELATRLALLLWDSIPDDALLARAESGELTDPAMLAAEGQRLLESPNADTALARLLREWTQTQELTPSDKDQAVFPFFDSAYARSLNGAFDRFAVDQLRRGTLTTLLTTHATYVDAELAPELGVPSPPAGQWVKVELDGTRHVGVATQPLVLATNAHTNDASYVFRGRMVRKRLLCDAFGAPPADAQAQFAQVQLPPDPTGKEKSAAVTANTTCRSCHALMDPAGLSLEHFDGAGSWRETYSSGRAIDVTGRLPGVDGAAVDFQSPADLFPQLSQSDAFLDCTARQLFRFAFSRAESAADACTVQAISDALTASNGSLAAALTALIATDAFSYRSDE